MYRKNPRRGKDLTQGSIWKTLFALSGPLVLGMTLRIVLNITDTYFVGLLGYEELAAISVTFPVFFIFIAVGSGLSVGSAALISQAIGARKLERASNIAEHSLIIAAVLGTILGTLAFVFSPAIFSFMGVSGRILEMTLSYTNLVFFGFVFVFTDFVAQSIINADGNTSIPTRNLFFSVMLNIMLDPVFIFGFGPFPAMGLFGAAVATFISFSLSISLNIIYVLRNRTSVKISPKTFRWDGSIVKRIISIGLPSSMSQSINSIGMILMMSMVGAFGTEAIAAFGVGIRLESLAILPVIGLVGGIIPFVGQNLGACNIRRTKKAVSIAAYTAAIFMLLFSLVWILLPEILYSPFTSNPRIVGIGSEYFRIIAFGYVFLGLNFVLGAGFQGAGKTKLQFMINIVRWASVIVTAHILSGIIGIQGVWTGFPVGNFLAFLVSFACLKSGIWLEEWESNCKEKRL